MYYSALIHSMGEACRSGEVYLAKDLKLKNRVICLILLLMEEYCSPVTALIHFASVAARHSFPERLN